MNQCRRGLLLILCLFTIALHICARAQQQNTPAEPADAPQVHAEIALIEKLLPTLPDRGAALFVLATDYAHLGNLPQARSLLKEALLLDEGFDPATSRALKTLQDDPEIKPLAERVRSKDAPVSRASLAFTVPDKDLIPEGIAYDATHRIFYLGSLYRRKIVKITRAGAISDFVAAGRYNLLPVLGIKVDGKDASVWANTGEDTGTSELVHFDAAGKLLGRYKTNDSGKHLFNDLVLRRSNEIILTDSLSGNVYSFLPATGHFSKVALHRPLIYPNGIALADDDHTAYVADALGVVQVNLITGISHDVAPGPKNTLAAFDGLYWYHGSLLGIQNGLIPSRVAIFRLSPDGLRVSHTVVLENRTGFVKLPTTGAIADGNFYFMANTQLDNLDGDGKVLNPAKLEPVQIAVLPLPEQP